MAVGARAPLVAQYVWLTWLVTCFSQPRGRRTFERYISCGILLIMHVGEPRWWQCARRGLTVETGKRMMITTRPEIRQPRSRQRGGGAIASRILLIMHQRKHPEWQCARRRRTVETVERHHNQPSQGGNRQATFARQPRRGVRSASHGSGVQL